jgi:DNA-directed RNA polymerase specialized sigma24 family protein
MQSKGHVPLSLRGTGLNNVVSAIQSSVQEELEICPAEENLDGISEPACAISLMESTLDEITLREEEQLVKKLLNQLTPKQALVIQLALSNEPVAQVAEMMHISTSAAHQLLARATVRLRRLVHGRPN